MSVNSRHTRDVTERIVVKKQLPEIRRRHAEQVVVFCGGCFDVLHAGHAVFINQCAALGDVLIVGVARDSAIAMLKGPLRPINPENNRLYLVANLMSVDYALLTDDLEESSDVAEILELLRPDVFAVTEGDAMAINAEMARCERLGIRMQRVPRIVPEGLTLSSSTEIVSKQGLQRW